MEITYRAILEAGKGMIITDGKETYGRKVSTPKGREQDFYEITEAEYEEILAAQEQDAAQLASL